MSETDPPLREVTLEEALGIAILFQKHGQLGDAEALYQQILEKVPDHPDVLHFAGVLAHQQGKSEEAISLIRQSLELDPNQADCYSNLGIVFKARGQFGDAVDAYRRAIAINPDHANAYSNLGVLLKAEDKPAEAEEAYRTAIRLNPEHIEAHHNLGVLLASIGRTREAVECYCRVTTLSPKHPEARRLLAMAHCTLGETDKAVQIFRDWLAEEPASSIAQHMLAATSGEGVPPRAADDYVEKIFDDFASSFDQKLTSLSYRAPDIVAAMLADTGRPAAKDLVILDAGCGTGLCGPLLAPWARRLVGVDLSSGMLTRAGEKGVYDDLVKAELTGFLRSHPAEFDVIVSADTLVYFGDLADVVDAGARALCDGGVMIFTLEEMEHDGQMFALHSHGRYAHAPEYVRAQLGAAGLEAEIVRAELRMEGGQPVKGLAVRGTKPMGGVHG